MKGEVAAGWALAANAPFGSEPRRLITFRVDSSTGEGAEQLRRSRKWSSTTRNAPGIQPWELGSKSDIEAQAPLKSQQLVRPCYVYDDSATSGGQEKGGETVYPGGRMRARSWYAAALRIW